MYFLLTDVLMLYISISTSYRHTSHSQYKAQRNVNLLLVKKVDSTLYNIPHAKYSRKYSFKLSTVLRLNVSCQAVCSLSYYFWWYLNVLCAYRCAHFF